MAWIGSAGVAIWNGLVPGATEDFEQWHDDEHIAERLSIPGFLRARRALAADGSGEYLTLYEVADVEALTRGGYPRRLDSPTEWTRRILPLFRGAARILCRVATTCGSADGDHLVALRLPEWPPTAAERLEAARRSGALLVSEGSLAGFALLLRDDALTARRTTEHDLRAERLATPSGLLLGEAHGRARAEAAARALAEASGAGESGGATVYRVQARRPESARSS